MTYNILMFSHLLTVVTCIFLGADLLLIMKKGTAVHRNTGKLYMMLMLITSIITLFMPADVGPQVLNHFGWIHLFSFLTLYTVPTAYTAVRKGNIKAHQRKMLLLYLGAIVIAGGFTFTPGRYLYGLFFG